MDPITLIPTPDPIQVPWGWFQFFLILTFFIHLLFMNLMIGGGIIVFVKQFFHPQESAPQANDVANKLTYAIAFAVNFGVAPLLFLQVLYGHFMYASSILMGVFWLSIIGLLITAYYLAYLYKFQFDNLAAIRNRLLGASVLILLVIEFFFTNNMTLMLTPEVWPAYFDHPGGTFLNLAEPTLSSRYLHFVIGAIATGGLGLAVLAHFQKELADKDRRARIKSGLQWFTFATMVEIGVGIVFLFNLPPAVYKLFVGGAWLHTAVFLAAMAGSVFCVIYGIKENLWKAVGALSATILLMVLVRDLARHAYLEPYFTPSQLEVIPQYSPLVGFVIVLVVGVAFIWYMLRLAWLSGKEVQ